ncbi:MAG: hypothetical protein DRP47_04945 [Candidatus Zixiibacteriota bacterium]|nr:MAG: hypothetical protein DRP47_04945 [candidate division Zixibacteria bacterium]
MNKNRNTFGIILIIIGCFLVLRTIAPDIFGINNMARYLLPLGLIALGGWLIVRKRHKDEYYSPSQKSTDATSDTHTYGTYSSKTGYESSNHTNDADPKSKMSSGSQTYSSSGPARSTRFNKLFGDTYVDCKDMNLQSVEVSSGIGDVEIKVHGGILADGLNRMIISGFIGDCRILIPPDLKMFAHCSNFIGDVEIIGKRATGFGNNLDVQSPDYASADKRLYIAANSFIGDIKIMEV